MGILLFLGPTLLDELVMILFSIILVDVSVPGRGRAVDGTLAPLESARGCLACCWRPRGVVVGYRVSLRVPRQEIWGQKDSRTIPLCAHSPVGCWGGGEFSQARGFLDALLVLVLVLVYRRVCQLPRTKAGEGAFDGKGRTGHDGVWWS